MTTIRDAWAKYKYRRLLARLAGPRLLSTFADAYPEAFFVEIGANDGENFDHLQPFVTTRPWRGIMVEPVPYVFARLQANHGDRPGIMLENAAIADREGRLPFYHLREVTGPERARLPEFYDALGSFSREAVLAHEPQIPDIRERIVTIEVPALSFDSLMDKHGVERVDLVLIDTEGYDFEVIRSIDLVRHRPRLLIYEHFHLAPAQRTACRDHLADLGYETLEEGFDTFCLDPQPLDALTRAFRRLEPAVAGVTKLDEAAA